MKRALLAVCAALFVLCSCSTVPTMPDDWQQPRRCVNDRILISIRNPKSHTADDGRMGRFWGYMNSKGEIVIEPKYAYALEFKKGAAQVWEATSTYAIDPSGRPIEYQNLVRLWGPDELYVPMQGTRKQWGYRNLFLEDLVYIEPAYDEVFNFRNGVAEVRIDRKWFRINPEGRILEQIDAPTPVEEVDDSRFIPARGANGLWGFRERDGDHYIPAQFDQVDRFHEGLCWVRKGDKVGFINEEGQWAIAPK